MVEARQLTPGKPRLVDSKLMRFAGPASVLFFERYGEEFDVQTGYGGIEIWLPITA